MVISPARLPTSTEDLPAYLPAVAHTVIFNTSCLCLCVERHGVFLGGKIPVCVHLRLHASTRTLARMRTRKCTLHAQSHKRAQDLIICVRERVSWFEIKSSAFPQPSLPLPSLPWCVSAACMKNRIFASSPKMTALYRSVCIRTVSAS